MNRQTNTIQNVVTMRLYQDLNTAACCTRQQIAHFSLPFRMQMGLWILNEKQCSWGRRKYCNNNWQSVSYTEPNISRTVIFADLCSHCERILQAYNIHTRILSKRDTCPRTHFTKPCLNLVFKS